MEEIAGVVRGDYSNLEDRRRLAAILHRDSGGFCAIHKTIFLQEEEFAFLDAEHILFCGPRLWDMIQEKLPVAIKRREAMN